MPTPHSNVLYVEPNSVYYDWSNAKEDGYERAPRLEDYCVAMNIEVEVCSRLNSGTDPQSEVMILSWDSQKGKNDTISFMSGTKIGGWKYDNDGIARSGRLNEKKFGTYNALTTYYADMYVGDLIDYGTTEMLGIKSVDIKYQKSCVPIITIQFTDVRGISLFQPTELSRDNSYNGIKGLNKTNIAQSFFQCFFRMPMPKFTIYIKGFYGRPVAYEVMCDSFQTNLNSETGDYDITARFIGYSYSFMTDVSLDALLVAPYSDYKGKQYWQDKVNDGTFALWDKTHTHKKPMPTLYEAKIDIERLLNTSNKEMQKSTLTAEEDTHEEEIAKLKSIRANYKEWYEQLFKLLIKKYGKRYCFLFKENGDDGDYYRIIVLVNSSKKDVTDLSSEYQQFPDDFKKKNNNMYSLVDEYNNCGYSYKKLENVSLDFKSYKKQKLFNACYISDGEKKVKFGGFDRNCTISRKELIATMFNETNTDYTLYTIYGDGTDQYLDGFVIDLDYSDIKSRLNALEIDANKSLDVKTKEKSIKEHNRIMIESMKWYPTVENFTRIMLAHFETLIHMMYEVKKDIGNRTPKELGVKIGEVGISDVNKNEKYIPPFPRVTRNYLDENGNPKIEDDWVGNLTNGEGFKEVEIVDGIFNAVEYIQQLNKQDNEVLDSLKKDSNENETLIKTPLTPFDFFIKGNPYGTDKDIINDPNTFAAKICMRMYSILGLNMFAKQYGDKWNISNSDFLNKIAKVEAQNFYNNVKLTNRRILEMLSGSNDSAVLNPQNIIELITTNKSIDNSKVVWGDRKLFNEKFELSGYKTNDGICIYPIQNVSLSSLTNTFKVFNEGKIEATNEDIILNKINANKNYKALINSSNYSVFNTLYIEDDFNKIKNALDGSMSSSNDDYKDVYDILVTDSLFNAEEYSKFILCDGRTSFKKKIGLDSKRRTYVDYDEDELKIYDKTYTISPDDTLAYASECEGGNISSFILTEAFGFDKDSKGGYIIDYNNSLFNKGMIDKLGDKKQKTSFFLMLLDCINHIASFNTLNSKKRAFNYLPKLAVLQIGAILSTLNGKLDKKLTVNEVRKSIPFPERNETLLKYLNKINNMAKIAYIKYFDAWVTSNFSKISTLTNTSGSVYSTVYYEDSDATSNTRRLFNELSETIIELTNDLMKPILVVSSNVFTNNGSVNQINKNYIETYLNTFLEKLKEFYKIGYAEDNEGNITKITETPKNTSIDMKKELYRYLKQLYDKWIASNTEEKWKMETFFNYKEKNDGHLFHFIDSFYNRIGDKLLINPSGLAEKIRAAFDDNLGDVNIMMLGFMADIYAKNKCMLLSLQNFMDLNDKTSMNDMFKPIPYNEMQNPNKHPDFVVLYPHEPSKNLNVDNAEYVDDGFMLNDENETPIAIRSKNDNGYKIPAFGVSYGKQYQSYFKRVNVNTNSPIATQQAIQMKHAILRSAIGGTKKGTVGQDIYDIYTTQSFTCEVEMMGCAWVQPLMYFSLLNVPMFRGSYLIFEVNHRLTPGNMTTTFKGARMGKFATSFVEDMFTDESDISNAEQLYEETERNAAADVYNDCEYKVYPLVEDSNLKPLDNATIEKSRALMNNVMDTLYGGNKGKEYKIASAGIVGNMFKESSFDYLACGKDSDSFFAAGLCGWNDRYKNLTKLLTKNPNKYGHDGQNETNHWKHDDVVKKLKENGIDAQIKFLNDTINQVTISSKNNNKFDKNKLLNAPTAYDAAIMFENAYERSDGKSNEIRGKRAQEFYDRYHESNENNVSTSTTNANDSKLNNTDVRDLFLNALNKSCNSTTAVNCNVKKGNISAIEGENVLEIKQHNGKTDKLSTIFDIILNGYYNYVQKVWWCYSKDTSEEPSRLFVQPSMHVKEQYRRINVCSYNNGNLITPRNLSENANKKLMTVLAKKYYGKIEEKIFNSEVPQLRGRYSTLSGLSITSCGSVIGGDNTPVSTPSKTVKGDKGNIDGWNVERATSHIKTNAGTESSHMCASYVEDAIAAGGGPLSKRMYCGNSPRGGGAATNLRYGGILEKKGFVKIDDGTVNSNGNPSIALQSGDVAIIGAKNSGKFHACMYTKEGWYSDFKQNNMNPYGKDMPYAVYRFRNKPLNLA